MNNWCYFHLKIDINIKSKHQRQKVALVLPTCELVVKLLFYYIYVYCRCGPRTIRCRDLTSLLFSDGVERLELDPLRLDGRLVLVVPPPLSPFSRTSPPRWSPFGCGLDTSWTTRITLSRLRTGNWGGGVQTFKRNNMFLKIITVETKRNVMTKSIFIITIDYLLSQHCIINTYYKLRNFRRQLFELLWIWM